MTTARTVEITRVEDLRPGDVVRATYRGHPFTGEVWVNTDDGALRVGPAWVEWLGAGDHLEDYNYRFVGATREVPDLPTEPGSVIVNATIRGVEGQTAILDTSGAWYTTVRVEGYYWWHAPKHITAWEPGRIVPEGGAS